MALDAFRDAIALFQQWWISDRSLTIGVERKRALTG
jgi:hypothetical protein